MPEDQARPQAAKRLLASLERQLDLIEYFRPLDKRATMLVNLRNIFARMQPTSRTSRPCTASSSPSRRAARTGARRRARRRGGDRAARAARGIRRGARTRRARARARAVAAAAPQPHRRRARAVGWPHQGPALRRQGLQAAGAGGNAHYRFCLVPAARDAVDLAPVRENTPPPARVRASAHS